MMDVNNSGIHEYLWRFGILYEYRSSSVIYSYVTRIRYIVNLYTLCKGIYKRYSFPLLFLSLSLPHFLGPQVPHPLWIRACLVSMRESNKFTYIQVDTDTIKCLNCICLFSYFKFFQPFDSERNIMR